jgi:pimeloyl-ACP methyl ester carboxylesterase
LRQAARDVRGKVIADCGHFIPEEAPEELIQHLLEFFRRKVIRALTPP